MLLNQRISHTINVIHHYVIIAHGCYEISGFEVKVGECQCDGFQQRRNDVPHALCVSLVVHRPFLGLYHPHFLCGRTATALDL